jgi:hypothetical protein
MKVRTLKEIEEEKMTEQNEQKVIKLTPDQILEAEVNLEKTKFNLEMTELNIKQFERSLESGLPMKTAQVELNRMKAQLKTLKHNIIAYQEQINKGEA